VHVELPTTILYFPSAQAEHSPPFGPVKPSLQTQLANSVEPMTDCVLLEGHARQVVLLTAPNVVEYVFAMQLMHVAVVEAPDVVEYFPASQSTQELDSVAPEVVRYLPAVQF